MENFSHLMGIVMSFSLGLREYEGKYYIILEDDITDLVHYEEHIDLRNKAIMELLSIESEFAFRYIKRFRDIIKEIERDFFKVRDYSNEATLEQFEAVSGLRGVIVRRSAWREDTIVTANFINSLENNIWARVFIVEQIEEALVSVIQNKLPDLVSIFVEDGVIDNLPNNPETDKYMDWSIWHKINEEGVLINIDSPNTNNHHDTKEFFSFLTEAGKAIYKDINGYYRGARPVDVFAVFYAMSDLNLILAENKNLYKLTRQTVADMLSSAFETPLSTQIVGYNIGIYENRSQKQQERILGAKSIINRFLEKNLQKFSEKD